MKIQVQQSDNIDRLDKFITAKLPHLSRTFIQKQIKDGLVTVNREKQNQHFKPEIGDCIEIEKTEKDIPDISPDKEVVFDIIDQTDDYVIINKPAGLVVHPAQGIHEPTLVNGLLARFPEIADAGEDALRPGIVHRMDRDVSGLMVISRTQSMFEHLKHQFQQRAIDKEYTALAHGIIDEEYGVIDTPIGRSKTKDGKMAAHPTETDGDRAARTEFMVLERVKNYTLLKVKILTGRTHQIRVHLNSIGHPVVGDTLYKNKGIKQVNLDRLFLHASKLCFRDLNGEWKKYVSELPEQLKQFYETLK